MSDWMRSLSRCEKLMAPSTRKRGSAGIGTAATAALSCMGGGQQGTDRVMTGDFTLLAGPSPVLRECRDEAVRALCFLEGDRFPLGRDRLHRGARTHRLPGRGR